MKKALLLRKGALVKPGEIFVRRISPLRTSTAFASDEPPWDSPSPVGILWCDP